MADKKISQLTAADSVDGTELVELAKDISGSLKPRSATLAQIAGLAGGGGSEVVNGTHTLTDVAGKTFITSDNAYLTLPKISDVADGTTFRIIKLSTGNRNVELYAQSGDKICWGTTSVEVELLRGVLSVWVTAKSSLLSGTDGWQVHSLQHIGYQPVFFTNSDVTLSATHTNWTYVVTNDRHFQATNSFLQCIIHNPEGYTVYIDSNYVSGGLTVSDGDKTTTAKMIRLYQDFGSLQAEMSS